MDKAQYETADHPSNNGYTTGYSGRGYKARRREETPSKTRKEVTPDGKQDYDRRRDEVSKGSSNGGKQKVTTPTDPHSSSMAIPGNHSEGLMSNGTTSRYHYRDVPPRFQLYSSKHGSSNKHFSNSKSLHSKTNHSSQGSNKKTKDTNNNHWSTNAGHTDNAAWCHTPDNETPSNGGRKDKYHGHNPWSSNVLQDSHWTSEDEFVNSDPIGDEVGNIISDADKFTIDKRDGGSDFDDLEVEGLPTSSSDSTIGHHHQSHGRLRNDSDAMKDGVSSSNTVMQDEPLDGTLWRGHISRSSMGSSSSVNSAGSSSSWKGGNNGPRSNNGNNYQRSTSPRKHSRYENHRSLSTSGKPMLKYPPKPKKHVMDLDDAMDSLQCEPSGWGDLPSPKSSEVDTGTEVWGIPDDIKKKMKKDVKPGKSQSGGNGWIDGGHVDEWGVNNSMTSGGWVEPNYNSKGSGNNRLSNGPNQWNNASEPSWNNIDNRSSGFNDNVKLLIDMGFSLAESEDTLKRNNNNFEAALGDLLALVTVKEEEVPSDLSPSNFPLPGSITRGLQPGRNTNNRLSPSSSHSGGPSPRTTSPSLVQVSKDQSYQLHSTVGSTPATPTIPVTTQNHLLQMYQQQQQQQHSQIIGKLPRSLSTPHTDLSSINTQYVQKVLTQQLREHQMLKQQLVNQMKNPQSPKHQHVLTLRLNQANASILLVNQHLVMTNQLAIQQQKGIVDSKGPPIGSKDSSAFSKTMSPPEVFGLEGGQNPSEINSMGYTMQNMSLSRNDTVNQTSTRPVSKLHQIISNSGNHESDAFGSIDDQSVFEDDQQHRHLINKAVPTPISLPSPGFMSNNDMPDHTTINNSSKVQSSSSFTNAALQQPPPSSSSLSPLTSSGKFSRSVDEIPEFKPGVLWNPSPSSILSNPPFPNSRKPSHRSDNHRPDSIPLSSGNNVFSANDHPNFSESNSEIDYYRDPKYGNVHAPHQYHRPGSSSSMGPPTNPRYNSGNNNYANTPTGGYNTGGYYNNRPQSGQGFPRPSSGTPSQMFPPNQFNPNGGRNRQRLYSQQSGPAGYNDMGQRNRGYDGGRKWSFDGNPWGVPEKSGTSIWSVDSTESLLSPSVGSEMAFSPATEWKAPIRKPSLPVNLSSPTNCILLKNVPPQIDENSIREVCSEYSHVQACTFNSFNGSVLVYYRSKEEALQAKLGLDKNPIICGINVQPSFATEKAMATFSDQRTPNHTYSHRPSATARMDPSSQWLSSDSLNSPSTQQRVPSVGNRSPYHAMTPSRQDQYLGKKESTSSVWNRDFSAPGGPTMSSSSSLWSNGGILPGITNPWSAQSNPTEGDTSGLIGTSPSMSTFLPNDLF